MYMREWQTFYVTVQTRKPDKVTICCKAEDTDLMNFKKA